MAVPELVSNININTQNSTSNTGTIKNYLEPSLIRAMVLCPVGTIIPASAMVSQSAFSAYVYSFLQNNDRENRWFALINLDEFKDATKQPSVDDTGLNQQKVLKYNPLYEWRYLTNMGNFKESLGFNNEQDNYSIFFIDANGTWFGTLDPTGHQGLAAYTPQQIWIGDHMFLTDKKLNIYPISLQLSDRTEINDNFQYYAASTNPLLMQGLVNVTLQDVSTVLHTPLGTTSTTDIVFCGTYGQGSGDFGLTYGEDLLSTDIIAYNLTTAAALTISTLQVGQIMVSGQIYNYMWITLSAAPTTGDVVNVSLAEPSLLFTDLAAYLVNEEENTFNHTF